MVSLVGVLALAPLVVMDHLVLAAVPEGPIPVILLVLLAIALIKAGLEVEVPDQLVLVIFLTQALLAGQVQAIAVVVLLVGLRLLHLQVRAVTELQVQHSASVAVVAVVVALRLA
jgi:hypothetical protein